MKTTLKALALAASLTIAGSAFADPFDVTTLVDLTNSADFAARQDAINALISDKLADNTVAAWDENVALINQQGDGNVVFASVDQSGGAGNLAVIQQDASSAGAVAVVMQIGANNRAIVNQH